MIKEFMFRRVLEKSKVRGIRRLGFTFIEVLISLILLGIGLSFSARVFVAGRYFMKESINKTRAMEITSIHMDEYLTKSYDELVPVTTDLVTEGGFTWHAVISAADKTPVSPKVNIIPYKKIEVICEYDEQNINGVSAKKRVRLENLVVYPNMHIYSLAASPVTKEAKCYGSPCTTSAAVAATYDSAIMDLDFETKVRGDLVIFYNIAINITNKLNIGASDLIFTKCFITNLSSGNAQQYNIQTGTPIMTQLTVNNVVSVDRWPSSSTLANGLPAGKYKLRIVWFKDTDKGTIMGKKANIVMYHVEK